MCFLDSCVLGQRFDHFLDWLYPNIGLIGYLKMQALRTSFSPFKKKYDHFLAPWQKPTGLGLERSIW